MNQMHIVSIHPEPICRIAYENVSTKRVVVIGQLEVLKSTVTALPNKLDAILFTGDLQGRAVRPNDRLPGRLLGELLAEELQVLASHGAIPALDRIGVVLVGDLYARPEMDKRGGTGDVRSVWKAFANCCRWVVGVAGNHDMFGPSFSEAHVKAFNQQPQIHLLDGQAVNVDGLKVAGLSGIVGNPRRPFRRTEADFTAAVKRLSDDEPDLLLMHDGPDVPGYNFKGWTSVRQTLEVSKPTVVVRGHAYWRNPLFALRNNTQVLNVDSRAILAVRATDG